MLQKSVFPLNNPLSEKRPVITNTNKNIIKLGVDGGEGGERKIVKKPSGGVKLAEALLKCPRCGRTHKIVFRLGSPPNWERCTWCGELQPADGYRVVGYGLGLPQPLSSQEVQARAIESQIHKEG